MTKDKLWAAYVARNQSFGDDSAEITTTGAGIRKLFEQTWEFAFKACADTKAPPPTSPFDDFLRGFTGGKS